MARALHAEPARSIAVMPNNEEATKMCIRDSIYPPLTGGAFGTSNIGVNYGIMFLGYAASTWISQPITAVRCV